MTQKSRQISHISLIAILLTLPLLFLYQNCGEISLQKIDSNSTNAEFGTPLRFDKIETATSHSCGVTSDREVMCWGDNNVGQLGNGSTRPSATPVRVEGLSDVVQVSLGRFHSCALIINGEVKCWGKNDNGNLGSGIPAVTLPFSSTPISVLQSTGGTALSFVTQLSVGHNHSCVLISGGSIKCWGLNTNGMLGVDPATISSGIPVPVAGITTATQVSLGADHTCAVLSDNTAKCWGINTNGVLGNDSIPINGFSAFSATPVFVLGAAGGAPLSNVAQISLGGSHSCALMTDETVKCWGQNTLGQLGNNSLLNSTIPVQVTPLPEVTQISSGGNHSCAVLLDKTVMCWGRGDYGQLGNGTTDRSTLVPVPVSNLSNVVRLTLGTYHSCALLLEGEVQCWGINYEGQLGNGLITNTSTPNSIADLSDITQLTFSLYNTCALLSNKTVSCWGDNGYSQLGNDTTTSTIVPTTVLNASGSTVPLSNVSNISFGSYHVCALLVDPSNPSSRTAKCWGNGRGIPVPVASLTNIQQISLGGFNSCALLSNPTGNSVNCWPMPSLGGISSTTEILSAANNVTQVSVGTTHSCALMPDVSSPSDNIIKCWGRNNRGQLGDGTVTDSLTTPVLVSGITNASEISMGESHSCALLSDKTVKCWGFNTDGQLGNGDVAFTSSIPVEVQDANTGAALTDVVKIALGFNHSCAQLSTGEVKCWGSNRYGQLGVKGVVISNTARTSLLSYQGALVTGGYASAVMLNGQAKQVGRINGFVNIPVTLLELF